MEVDGLGLPTLVFEQPEFSGHEQFALAHDQIAPAIDTAPLGPTEEFRGAGRAPALAERLVGVVNAALAPVELVAPPEATLASMKSFIREHLDDLVARDRYEADAHREGIHGAP